MQCLHHMPTYLSKDGVLVVQLIRPVQSEKELTAIVVGSSVRHSNQAPPCEP